MSELININEDLLDKNKSSSSQMTPTFTGDRSEERELLKGMGFEEDENNNFVDDLITNRISNSNRFRVYEDTYRNSLGKDKIKENEKNDNKNGIECGICGEAINSTYKVYLKCRHHFCVDCWMDYLKEKITNANVSKILCMQQEH